MLPLADTLADSQRRLMMSGSEGLVPGRQNITPSQGPEVTLWLQGTYSVTLAAQELALPMGRGLC